MLDFMAQLDYLRDVQRTFGSGADRLDIIDILVKMFSVAAPVILAMLVWRYHQIILFVVFRFFSKLFSPGIRRVVHNYLVNRGVVLEIFLYSNQRIGRKIGNARISRISGGKMRLQLVDVKPTALNLKHNRVVCFTKPFTYSGNKLNAFFTYVSYVHKRGSVIKQMSLFTPIRYRFIIRRRHNRRRVARDWAVRVKAWNISKRKTFWMIRPELQTVDNPARYGRKMRLAVENISAGGIRLLILNPMGELPPLSPGSQLIMRISVWNPKTKKYSYFTVVGAVRSRFRGKGGTIGLGIQFIAEGVRTDGAYTWTSLRGELKSLAEFLEKTSA